ncbi:MAG: response regulator [Magnetococcales bacterium]|nr:response regulator [Magnetococcales bacterium]
MKKKDGLPWRGDVPKEGGARGGGVEAVAVGRESGRARLLVVDDDPLGQRLTEVMLRDWPVEVVCVGSGFEALERVMEVSWDLVLMDVRMPGLDGYETCRRIREWERLQGRERPVPVIALTGHVSAADKERARAAGMSDHLEKPLRIRKLHDRLVRWLTPGWDPSPVARGGKSGESHAAAGASVCSWEGSGETPILLDLAVLEVLRQELSRVPEAFVSLVGLYLEDMPLKLREMRRLLASGDPEGVSRVAHSLKSQCGAMGAVALHAVFVQLERFALEGDPEEVSALLARAELLFLHLVPTLKRIQSHPSRPIDSRKVML